MSVEIKARTARSAVEQLVDLAANTASGDATRESLTTVYVDEKHVMASDGHRMIFLKRR